MSERNPFTKTLVPMPLGRETTPSVEDAEPPEEPTLRIELQEHDRVSRYFQNMDVVTAREIHGFEGLDVAVTLEKKNENKGGGRNQDMIIADPHTGLVGVFDGLGATVNPDDASDLASDLLVPSFQEDLQRTDDPSPDIIHYIVETVPDTDAQDLLLQDEALTRKAVALYAALMRAQDRLLERKLMTTACVGFVHVAEDGTRWAMVGNVGDSGAFIRGRDGSLRRITDEGSLLNRLIDLNLLTVEDLYRLKTNLDEKKDVNGKGYDYLELSNTVMEPLGSETGIYPTFSLVRMEPGEDLLFCTDGVIDKYERLVTEMPPPEERTLDQMDLVEMSHDAGDGDTLEQRLDSLRVGAIFRRAYKYDDDIAIVGVHIPEGLKERVG
ncbi:MAG: protein phosphatase 2C domain-containing protein [Patescibacteria group bacterium]